MNNTCCGDLFYDKGLKYKCFLDSTIIEIADSVLEDCPNCGRPITADINNSIVAALKDTERNKDAYSKHIQTIRLLTAQRDGLSEELESTQQMLEAEKAKNADLCSGMLSVDETTGRLMYVCTTEKVSVYLSPDTSNSRCPVCGKLANQTISQQFFKIVADSARTFDQLVKERDALRLEIESVTTEAKYKLRKKNKKLKRKLEESEKEYDNVREHRDQLRIALGEKLELLAKAKEAEGTFRAAIKTLTTKLEQSAETSRLNVIEFERMKAELESVSYAYRTSESMLSMWHAKAMQAKIWAAAWKNAAKRWREEADVDYYLTRDAIIIKGKLQKRAEVPSKDSESESKLSGPVKCLRCKEVPAVLPCSGEDTWSVRCVKCKLETGPIVGYRNAWERWETLMHDWATWVTEDSDGESEPDEEPANIDLSKCYEYSTENAHEWGVNNANEKATEVWCKLGHEPTYFWVELGGRACCPSCGRIIASDNKRRLTEVARSEDSESESEPESMPVRPLPQDIVILARPKYGFSVGCLLGGHGLETFFVTRGETAPCPKCGRVLACSKEDMVLTNVVKPGAYSQMWIDFTKKISEVNCRCLSSFQATSSAYIQEGEAPFVCPVCRSTYSVVDGRVIRKDPSGS